MRFLLIILFAVTIYPLLGTLMGFLVILLVSTETKTKVILFVLIRPIVYSILIWLLFFPNSTILPFLIFVTIVMQETIFSPNKILTDLKFEDGNIVAEFYKPYLAKRKMEFKITDIKNFGLSGMKSIIDYPASLRLSTISETCQFSILDKALWAIINKRKTAANMG